MTYLAPVAPPVPVPSRDPALAILAVAEALQPDLAQGFQIDALRLRLEMERALGGSDADGAWDWKLAYEAGEVALVLFLRKFGRALLARAGSPSALLPLVAKVAALLPTHTRRSEEMERFQQFSTPLPMGLAALAAAQITPRDLVLEPSAGTGLLAILAEIAGGSLALNELADTRADLLRLLFPGRPVTSFDAAQIDDHLDAGLRPSVILMNPPFSAVANVDGRSTEATARHLRSALARLAPAGRLVAITGAGFAPDAPAWSETFGRLADARSGMPSRRHADHRMACTHLAGSRCGRCDHPTARPRPAGRAEQVDPDPRAVGAQGLGRNRRHPGRNCRACCSAA
jgi:hypothetical protein